MSSITVFALVVLAVWLSIETIYHEDAPYQEPWFREDEDND